MAWWSAGNWNSEKPVGRELWELEFKSADSTVGGQATNLTNSCKCRHINLCIYKIYIPSWWFQPLWNIWVKMGSSSPGFGLNIKIISKPPSRYISGKQMLYNPYKLLGCSSFFEGLHLHPLWPPLRSGSTSRWMPRFAWEPGKVLPYASGG